MQLIMWAILFVAGSALLPESNVAAGFNGQNDGKERRVRAREIGIAPGIFKTGKYNAITDVAGVLVGQVTVDGGPGSETHTGVTVILPHGGNIFQNKVPAGFVVGNAYGKAMGSTQIVELGEIETPIALTNTLSVSIGAMALIDWTLA